MSTGLVRQQRKKGREKPKKGGEKRDPVATRRALLEAGAHLFPRRGFDGVSIEDLAERAGVNKALVSYHFGGKRGLYVAGLESAFAEMAVRLRTVDEDGIDAREGLHRFFRAFEAMTKERPDFPTLFLRELLSSGIEPPVVPHLLEILAVTRGLAERGRREGVFRRVDPLLFHFGLVGALAFFFATEGPRQRARAAGQLPFEMPTAQAFVRYLEEMTLRGLAPGPSPTRSKKRKGARS